MEGLAEGFLVVWSSMGELAEGFLVVGLVGDGRARRVVGCRWESWPRGSSSCGRSSMGELAEGFLVVRSVVDGRAGVMDVGSG